MATATLIEEVVEQSEQIASLAAEPAEHYEIVAGQVVEERPLGAREVWITSVIADDIVLFSAGKSLGRKYEEMLFILADEPRLRRRPDVAFVSAERWPIDKPAPSVAAWDVVPDLAVEIVSPTDLVEDLMSKIEEYFRAGVRLVWVVHPSVQKLYTYESPKMVRILDAADTLSGGVVLPGFEMPLRKIFVANRPEPGPATP